ncbi:hypothetical protein WA026_019732 [Henosepilachna vigintioctopunctata]|uniref:Cilia- and flagella-associated protein 43 n=1 Tax=Henosepilachna vigintioctopunctata TaxID=420089 RepID=A0AAW1UHT2_9CUCU
MDAISNPTEWCLIGRLQTMQLMGKEVLFYGLGCHLYFINMATNENSIYRANNSQCGDGIRFYCGHKSLNFFAFAENCGNPSIFVMNYPSFDTIAVLEGGSKEGYVGLGFSETSLLISLGTLPYFTITVWNWRKGEKLGSSRSHIYRQNQEIRCNSINPVRVAQLGNKTLKLHIWDVLMCGRKCIMTHHRVKLPQEKPAPFITTHWSNDGVLYVLDNDGCVHIVNGDYVIEKIISFSKPGSITPAFTFWRGELAISGPPMLLRFYKRTGPSWSLYNSFKPPEPIYKLKSNKTDMLVGLTDRAHLVKIDPDNKKYDFIKSNESEFHNICLVYPVGQYVCVLSQANMVSVIEISTGEVVSRYDIMGTALTMAGNPEFPYIGIGYINGILELVSIYDPLNPTTMVNFTLTTNQISSVYFSEFGRVLVAADVAFGEFFILEGIPGGTIKIIATVSTRFQVVDYMLVPSTNCYRLFVIPITSNEFIIGKKIIRYCIMDKDRIDIKEYMFPNPNKFYCRILSTSKINRDRVFYVMPFNAKVIEEVETRRGDSSIRILNRFETGHQVRKNGLYIDKHHAVTWGYDGFVIARTADFKETVGIVLPHHRRNGGVKKALIDPTGKYIVSLGYDNIVACSNLIDREENHEMREELMKLLNSSRYALLFQRKTTGFDPGAEFREYTWLELDRMQKIEQERKLCEGEKASILAEFQEIREELRNLLNQNLEGPDNEKLDLVEFNLNTKYFDDMKEKNRVECKETEQHMKKYTAALNKVCDNIKKQCYDTMQVHQRKIVGISSGVNVQKYAILPPDGSKMEELSWVKEQMKLERFVNDDDTFRPWEPIEPTKRMEFLRRAPKVPVTLVGKNIEDLEEETELAVIDHETEIAMAGSTAQNFIEISEDKYSQLETQTYYQLKFLSAVTEDDTVRLREYFNKEFENLMQQKIREVGQIREKNDRLRHIVDEINYFSTEKIFISISDPVWNAYENVETMVSIEDTEVPIKPYISPSEQAILDAKAAEAERIRLLLLADDFKERALMAMMNGVLEVRWEDELKKNVPLPKCMIEKQPEEFNEEDLRAVKDYEEKVKFLNSERERYKYLLDQEYSKITTQVRESVKKFDMRINDLLLLYIKVNEAIIQEVLILCKERMKLLDRLAFGDKELELKKTMVGNEELIQGLQQLINSLAESLTDCRSQIEAVQNREKFLDKNLKKELSEFNQVVQEASVKILKRRPKMSYKNLSSHTMLQVLAKAVITKERSPLLTEECLEYLNMLDHMDEYTGVPPTVDEEAYAVICKHRRFRIEYEIKLKAAVADLAEAEASVAILQRRLLVKKDQNVKTMADLADIRTERLTRMKNSQMQIVLKQGYVEVPMHGNISDFKDAILVPRKEVEEINKLILEHGKIKLNTMRHTMTFHREIMKTEWIHKKHRMHIEDLREVINDITNLKVTKEMQTYLKGKEKVLPFEVELEVLKNSYQAIVDEKKHAVYKLRKQINALRENTKKLDFEITDVNVDVCEFKLDKDWELERMKKQLIDERVETLAKRSKMIRKIQENHQTILLLQTELELLRLKTYPTIKYKILTQ